ncbi:MAG TPA: hypothetical protein VN256_17700 [Pyrinomonadaceae bacterium]|nr:hypothetical protein [Pyrinomonadaceae bacterium]
MRRRFGLTSFQWGIVLSVAAGVAVCTVLAFIFRKPTYVTFPVTNNLALNVVLRCVLNASIVAAAVGLYLHKGNREKDRKRNR